jgi:hypothetical protein
MATSAKNMASEKPRNRFIRNLHKGKWNAADAFPGAVA